MKCLRCNTEMEDAKLLYHNPIIKFQRSSAVSGISCGVPDYSNFVSNIEEKPNDCSVFMSKEKKYMNADKREIIYNDNFYVSAKYCSKCGHIELFAGKQFW